MSNVKESTNKLHIENILNISRQSINDYLKDKDIPEEVFSRILLTVCGKLSALAIVATDPTPNQNESKNKNQELLKYFIKFVNDEIEHYQGQYEKSTTK